MPHLCPLLLALCLLLAGCSPEPDLTQTGVWQIDSQTVGVALDGAESGLVMLQPFACEDPASNLACAVDHGAALPDTSSYVSITTSTLTIFMPQSWEAYLDAERGEVVWYLDGNEVTATRIPDPVRQRMIEERR